MTAPDNSADLRKVSAPDHEPICGPSCDPDCGMGHCYLTDGPYEETEHAHNASEHANEHALRDQVRDTIHAATPGCEQYHAAECRPCTARTSLLMRLAVQPELDRLRARLDYWRRRALVHARAAETAEQRLAELREEARDE